MSKANVSTTPIRRRAILAGIASAAALPVAAGIISTAATADPIFAAIEAERQADAAFLTVPFGVDIPDEVGDRWSEAFSVVMRTRPTTPAGLAALTSWARERADWLRANGTEARDNFCTVSATIDDATRAMIGLEPWSPSITPLVLREG